MRRAPAVSSTFVQDPSAFVGRVVADKYRVEAVIGVGGMGVVYRATHMGHGHKVALKVLRTSGVGEEEATRRFLREARATFALTSPHTIRLYDVGELPPLGLTMVMELLEGASLRDLLEAKGPMGEDAAVNYTVEACRSLAEAHARGIVHRDIKPGNLFVANVEGRRTLKVLDFGLARAFGDLESGPLTAPATALGTPRYMAPEQWLGSDVDGRADLYALGVVLHQMLTGQVPLEDVPLHDRVGRLLLGVPSPRDIRRDLSEGIARVLLRCLRPIPDERYRTAQEFEDALLARGSPPSARTFSTTRGRGPAVAGRIAGGLVTGAAPADDEGPLTAREPGRREARPAFSERPDFDVNVYTGARIHPGQDVDEPFAAPSADVDLGDRAPSSATDVGLVRERAATPRPAPRAAIEPAAPAREVVLTKVRPGLKALPEATAPPPPPRAFVFVFVAVAAALLAGVALAMLLFR